MMQSQRGAQNHLLRPTEYWDGLVQSNWVSGVFHSPASQFKKQPPHSSQTNNSGRLPYSPRLPNPRRWLTENGQILEDGLPRVAKSQLTTSRFWPGPVHQLPWSGVTGKSVCKSQKRIWWNQKPKTIFRGQAIPACRKPEWIGIFKLVFRERKKQLWLDRAIAEIPKPH